jgi:glycosyltransferase involved in cell wall biosynthesis
MMTISAIIPTRDRPHYLEAAVNSLLSQSEPPAEIIVVDDGTGATEAIARRAASIRVLNNHRRGPVPARILGVQAAHGEAILFLDDDDWLTDTAYLSAVDQAFAAGADFCFCDGAMMFDSGVPALAYARGADAASLAHDNTILISGACYARRLHARLGNFDTALPYYWDWDWYLRVARSGARLQRIATPSVAIRVHDGNMSGESHTAARRANLDRLAEKHHLGPVVLKNHLSLMHEAETSGEILWNTT